MPLHPETAERIERCIESAHLALIEQLAAQNRNRLGAEVRRFSDAVVGTRVVAQPDVQWLQHVVGLAPASISFVADIVAWYFEHDLHPRFEVAPAPGFAPLAAVLTAAGFHQADFVDLLWAHAAGVTADLRAFDEGVDVHPVEAGSEEADEFARVLLTGHEVDGEAPPEHHAALAALTGLSGRRCYLARIEGTAVGAAILTVLDGVGYLTNASTVPEARGMGVQRALIARRIADAEAAACDVLAGLANPWGTSHRNIERAGLNVAYTKVSWLATGR